MIPDFREIAEAFNGRARTYSRTGWHKRCAERLVELCLLRPGDRVLDAATGTGLAALAAAKIVGEQGCLLGVDISSGMLREARDAVNASGLSNVELLEADAVCMPHHAPETFDVVTCAAGLLYMPVAEALREWRRLIKPGGLVAFSSMHTGSPPAGQMFRDCAAEFGLSLRDPCEPLGTDAACLVVLEDAGLKVAEIVSEAIEFSAQDLTVAWDSNFRSAGHSAVRALSVADQGALKKAYIEALAREVEQNPARLARADVRYVLGRR